jgi:cytochrome c oxidase accessory protein FixG
MSSKTIPLAVLADDGGMYRAAGKIYPREISGRFQRLRTAAVFWLLGMFYLFPWLNYDGRQAVLFDLPARRFFIFGMQFWPQDFIFLSWLLIIAGLSLFFFTAVAGRLWCGYACPQTVWTEVFIWLERVTEGDRGARMKLDAAPWSANKVARKGAKQFLWITFALWTGFTFVGFFTPIRELAARALSLELGAWETFWTFFYGFATYGNAGYLREQVCKYMCPYARFQGAMFDRNTLIISYDAQRGEPRGARKKGSDYRALGLGDCIDCTICVQVCPTGIDIRNGLQYECIACGACVDACDAVMDKVGYPRGLVRYATQNRMEGKRVRVLRPRVLIYASLLMALILGFAWAVTHRVPLLVDVLRDRNALYRETADGQIENAYTLKIMNKDAHPRRFRVSLLEAGALSAPTQEVDVAAQGLSTVSVTLRAPREAVHGATDIRFRVERIDDAGVAREERSRFFGPM